MSGNREKTQEFILDYIEKIAPGGANKKIYLDYFSTLDDDGFDEFIQKLEQEEFTLSIVAPNFSDIRLDVDRNIEIGKELGHDFFQRIWVPETEDTPSYLTPNKYMVLDLPVKRQAQILTKKITIADHNNTVDDMTGQPTGDSKGSKISYPETQVLAAFGLTQSLREFLKFRGGDEGGFNAMNTLIDRTGSVKLDGIEKFSTGVKSTQTVKVFLTSMHLKTTGLD